MEPYLGEIKPFGFGFIPRGYLPCDGRLLSIAQNSALYAILGTQYGGDGRTTFALPNLQGNIALSQGQMPGGSYYSVGEQSGTTNVTLLTSEIPSHNHGLQGASIESVGGLLQVPTASNCYLSNAVAKPSPSSTSGVLGRAYSNTVANAILGPATVGVTGGSQPHNNMMPYLAIYFGIAVEGIFPPHS